MIIRAAGEREAAEQLVAAAKTLGESQFGFQMRYLQTLNQVSENGATVVFASPTDSATAVAAAEMVQSDRAQRKLPQNRVGPDS
jgi:regulator of protease activity HflC (stomatin/prohibitin superfamily)